MRAKKQSFRSQLFQLAIAAVFFASAGVLLWYAFSGGTSRKKEEHLDIRPLPAPVAASLGIDEDNNGIPDALDQFHSTDAQPVPDFMSSIKPIPPDEGTDDPFAD